MVTSEIVSLGLLAIKSPDLIINHKKEEFNQLCKNELIDCLDLVVALKKSNLSDEKLNKQCLDLFLILKNYSDIKIPRKNK